MCLTVTLAQLFCREGVLRRLGCCNLVACIGHVAWLDRVPCTRFTLGAIRLDDAENSLAAPRPKGNVSLGEKCRMTMGPQPSTLGPPATPFTTIDVDGYAILQTAVLAKTWLLQFGGVHRARSVAWPCSLHAIYFGSNPLARRRKQSCDAPTVAPRPKGNSASGPEIRFPGRISARF